MQSTICRSKNNFVCALLLTVVAFGSVLLLTATTWTGTLEIPLTDHANKAHQSQLLTPAQIQTKMTDKSCKPIEAYSCAVPGNEHVKVICPLDGAHWAGLIIGFNSGTAVVVTGYVANYDYWSKAIARDLCVPTVIIP